MVFGEAICAGGDVRCRPHVQALTDRIMEDLSNLVLQAPPHIGRTPLLIRVDSGLVLGDLGFFWNVSAVPPVCRVSPGGECRVRRKIGRKRGPRPCSAPDQQPCPTALASRP